QLRSVECTCLYVCRESRRQVSRRVRVTPETPRTLWDAGGPAAEVGNESGGKNKSSSSSSTVHSCAPTGSERKRAAGAGSAHKFSWHSKPGEKGPDAIVVAVASSTRGAGPPAAARPPPTPHAAAALPPPAPASVAAAAAAGYKRGCGTRVPLVRTVGIIWQLPATELLSPAFAWPRGVKDVQFGAMFDDRLHDVSFPEKLETLTFGHRFNKSLGPGCVRWPAGLKRLKLGATWNRRLTGCRGSWPASLEVLHFGTSFDKPLQGGDGIGLPSGLREIHLGGVFNQSLAGVE
ncbi:unnamed protein product, partial [Hapterophycus canaliculatus]